MTGCAICARGACTIASVATAIFRIKAAWLEALASGLRNAFLIAKAN